MADGYEDGIISGDNQPTARDRDQGGKFVKQSKPEVMFREREMEGAPNPAEQPLRITENDDDLSELVPERIGAKDDSVETTTESEEEGAESAPEVVAGDDGQKYEVMIDGEAHEVSLTEALNGYIREQTFHKRQTMLNEIQANMEKDAETLKQGWQLWHKARQDYEADLYSMVPPEPDWKVEFKRAEGNAAMLSHLVNQQESYRGIYANLAKSRSDRAARETADYQAAQEKLARYAVDNGNKFVARHAKLFPTKAEYDKNIQSMRRTALDAGFNEEQIAQVFDERMQTVLLWASKYRRMMAAQPKAVIPGKGRTLAPGSATPLNGNASRRGFEEASRQLASSGRLDDAAKVFERMYPS